MNSILISQNGVVSEGLKDMLAAAIGEHGYLLRYAEPEIAMLVVAIAKLAPDRPEWFPKGKWATIQSIETKINKELETITFETQ